MLEVHRSHTFQAVVATLLLLNSLDECKALACLEPALMSSLAASLLSLCITSECASLVNVHHTYKHADT